MGPEVSTVWCIQLLHGGTILKPKTRKVVLMPTKKVFPVTMDGDSFLIFDWNDPSGLVKLKKKPLGRSGTTYDLHVGFRNRTSGTAVFYHKDQYINEQDQKTGAIHYPPSQVSYRIIPVGPQPAQVNLSQASFATIPMTPYVGYIVDFQSGCLEISANRCASVCLVEWSCPPSYVT